MVFLARRRGFTLVELMIVVAIIGVLASLAVFGVRRYLSAVKASEAKNNLGAISRYAAAAYERELVPSESVSEGALSTFYSHYLCKSSTTVPAAVPKGKKYQPNTSDGNDFETGDPLTGWKCLRFGVSEPIHYQYKYTFGSSPMAPQSPAACVGGECFEAGAVGDLDGDGLNSYFSRNGYVNPQTKALKTSTLLYVENEAE